MALRKVLWAKHMLWGENARLIHPNPFTAGAHPPPHAAADAPPAPAPPPPTPAAPPDAQAQQAPPEAQWQGGEDEAAHCGIHSGALAPHPPLVDRTRHAI